MEAIRAFEAQQAAARAAALAAPADVPDGLAEGGLQPAAGETWLDAGQPVETSQGDRREVTIAQTAERAILTWTTFNVGRSTDLVFDQGRGGGDAAGWVALNRVVDPGAMPSRILGSIKAQGQVYVLNQNGILFGGTSQVNVGTLLASGLEISAPDRAGADARFLKDDLSRLSFGAMAWGGGGGDLARAVEVEAGAAIAAGSGGRVELLGENVRNGGALTAPDGQIFVAAGRTVEPTVNLDLARGLAPPVRAGELGNPGSSPVDDPGSEAVNTGILSAPRGDVTLAGGRTRQGGLVSVTNGAEARGSIHLGTSGVAGNISLDHDIDFTTELGAGSATLILPDSQDRKVLGSGATYRSSAVEVNGRRIDLLEGASIYAPGGKVSLFGYMTSRKPAGTEDPIALDTTRIYLAPGASIDVSGLDDVEVPMERSSVRAELRANELRDNPLLRAGPLRSRTVYFDARYGGKLADGTGVADLSGYYDVVERDVAELMTGGGSVTLSANQIILRQGSTVDLSGGNLRYLDGYVRRSVLVDPTGGRVPIEEAAPGVAYVALEGDFVVDHARWGARETFTSSLTRARPRFEPGYVEGGSAGTLTLTNERTAWNQAEWDAVFRPPPVIDAPAPANASATGAFRILDGEVVASRVIGPYQRELAGSSADPTLAWRAQPAGAALELRNAGDVTFGGAGPILPADFGLESVLDPTLRYQHALPAGWFDGQRFSALRVTSGYDSKQNVLVPGTENRAPAGHLSVGAGVAVDLGTAGTFEFTGKSAAVDGTIRAPGGRVAIAALDRGADPAATHLSIGPAGLIDVAGRWQNDALDGAEPVRALSGGAVSLAAGAISLAPGSRIDVSGGARLDSTGSKIAAGNGGSISLSVQEPRPNGRIPGEAATTPYLGDLAMDGTFDARALGKGGSLTVKMGREVVIGSQQDPGRGLFAPGFFTQGGFASYNLVGERGVTVAADLAPIAESFVAPPGAREIPSGALLASATGSAVARDPGGLGLATSLELSTGNSLYAGFTSPGVLLQEGRAILMQPGSTVTLGSSIGTTQVNGTIVSRGGTVNLVGDAAQLGDRASIDVSGYTRTRLAGVELVRSIEKGGRVRLGASLDGDPATVVVSLGATIDASGASGIADLPAPGMGGAEPGRFAPVAISGDAGSLAIAATDGTVQGTLKLQPGADPADGSRSRGAGGSLAVTSQNVILTQSAPSAGPGLRLVADTLNGAAADDISIQLIDPAAGGFDTSRRVLFEGDVTLTSRRSLALVSAVLGVSPGGDPAGTPHQVRLRSGYVALVGGGAQAAPSAGPSAPGSRLEVEAEVVDVARTVMIGAGADAGFETTRLSARGDLRLSDHDPAGRDTDVGGEASLPGLHSQGALELDAAQVYVASRGNRGDKPALERPDSHPGFLVSSATRIAVTSPPGAALPPLPLSFGERLTLRAPAVEQRGVLRAPAGQIRLEGKDDAGAATGSVTLFPGSTTSVSLVGPDGRGRLVPYGTVLADGTFFGYAGSTSNDPQAAVRAPSLSIQLGGAAVAVQRGAVVDVSGGGDLLGYAFIPGNGGSRDVLAYAADARANPLAAGKSLPTPFAVVPGMGQAPLPIGPAATLRDPRLAVGDQVWLEGVPGLPAGSYTLLPAHYALLPGGLLVQPLGGGYATAPGTFLRPDGALVVPGYRLSASGRRDGAYSQYAVMTSGVFGGYARIDIHSLDEFATRTAAEAGVAVRTPNDGGTASISATDLVLEGTGRFGAGTGGQAGRLDVAAAQIAVAAPDRAALYPGHVILDPEALDAFGAGSVLLGGTRTASTSSSAPGTVVRTAASEVVVDTGGVPWTGSEILLAASGRVVVADGSVLRAEGAAMPDATALRPSGSGTLVRLSTGGRVAVVRTGGSAGDLVVGSATLAAAGSIGLEAAGSVTLAPDVDLRSAQLDLSSKEVHLGDAPAGTTGTLLGTALIERLASSADLVVKASQMVATHGDLALGNRATGLHSLTLDAPLLAGQDGGTVRIAAGSLFLRNGGAPASAAAAGGSGVLELDVDSLDLGPGQVKLAGFDGLRGRARVTSIRGSGRLDSAGSLGTSAAPFLTGRIEAGSGQSYVIHFDGSAQWGADPGAASLPAVATLGSRLRLEASSLLLDTAVVLPGGSLEAVATGGALVLGSHARVDVAGRAVDFEDLTRFAPGGSIRLSTAADLTAAAGSVLDVSGSAQGGDAGRLEVVSPGGSMSLAGELRGSAAAVQRGASFFLDAGAVPSFSDLNRALESGGFTDAREIRLRGPGQDIRLDAGQGISAHDVTLRSDQGAVAVAGAVGLPGDDSHAAGGIIQLLGGAGLVLEGTASVEARAAATERGGYVPASGRVLLAAAEGGSVAVTGARIDVSGGREGGSIVVRAPRAGDGVALVALDGQFVGAAEKVVQGMREYQATAIDPAWLAANPVLPDADDWLASARARYPQGFAGFDLAPGIRVTSPGALTVSAEISLARTGPGGAVVPGGAGVLGLAAAGDVILAASVSDGFASASPSAWLLSGRSSGLEIEAGGDVRLGPNAIVRTGTGAISVRAGRDIVFQDATSVLYTAGEKAAAAPGFQGVALGEFPVHGGSIDLRAGRDVVAPLSRQTTSAWLFRYGDTTWNRDVESSAVAVQTAWSVVDKNFRQAVGALGGGDVRVRAGGDVRQLQVAIPTTGQLVTPVGGTPAAGDLVVRGGGDLDLFAGGDIAGGVFVLGRGLADLRAGGSVLADPTLRPSLRTNWSLTTLAPRPVGMLLGLADAQARVVAGAGATVEGAFDPMLQGQIAENLAGGTGSAFVGYSDRASLQVTSQAGAVSYLDDPWASLDLSRATPYEVRVATSSGLNNLFAAAPPTLRLASLLGSVSIDDGKSGAHGILQLSSSPRGTLDLVAGQDVRLAVDVSQEDLASSYIRDWRAPFSTALQPTTDGGVLANVSAPDVASTNSGRGFVPIHMGDPDPNRIYAAQGSVCAQTGGSCVPTYRTTYVSLFLAKPLMLQAGEDLLGGRFELRGNGPTDLSLIAAGRDLLQPIVSAYGQGSVLLSAGRNVELPPYAPSSGLFGMGNTSLDGQFVNAALPRDRAADIYVVAGAGPDRVNVDAFAAAYLDPANQRQRAIHDYLPDLRTFLSGLDPAAAGMSEAELVAAFAALPRLRRQIFLSGVLFSELRETGIDYNDAASPRFRSYDRGFAAVKAMFPVDPSSLAAGDRGNVIFQGTQVETRAQGGITVLAPYGRIEVGSEVLQSTVDPNQGGVVTRRGGDIRMMADQNIDLFTSRVFTLQGGDITMWTSNGDITAGSGAKTSVFQVPLRHLMTRNGLVQVDAFGLATGAGIGVLDALENAEGREPSRLDLIAPRGEVNAGDAGIRVVGNLNIAAAVVVGMDNIQASGAAQGVPKVEAPNFGALATASAVAQAAAKEAVAPPESARTTVADLPSIITVEVVGYETTDQPDETERKKKKD
jgi:filamentous hemagglutinin family protein